MKEKPARKKIGKYDILALLFGLGMLVAGIVGVVTSLAAADEYNHSDDIRTVDAVIERIERSEEKHVDKEDWNNKRKNYVETIHKMSLSFVVDGKAHEGKYDYRTFSYDPEKDEFYQQLKSGDTVSVEVYRSRNGEYKIVHEEAPVNFLLCCAAIFVGLIITAAMVYGMICPEKEQTDSKGKKRGKGKQNQTR